MLQVAQFIEKPDAAAAEAYVAAGTYVWNSGMFLSAATFLAELEAHNPEIWPSAAPPGKPTNRYGLHAARSRSLHTN